MENFTDELNQKRNLATKIFTSNHLDEIGFLIMILTMLVFSFLVFYFGLPTLLDKLEITTLFILF